MKWIFIIFFLLILAVYIVHIMHKRQWRKILGYKPTLDEMAIIADLENIQYTQDKIKNIINDYKKGLLDKSTIEALIKDEKVKLKSKKDFKETKEKIEYKKNTYDFKIDINRTLDIIYQSLHIAIQSKKLNTIESRIKVAIDNFNELKEIDNYSIKAIQDEYDKLLKEAYTAKYVNIAQVYYDKFQTLKTEKTRQKYFDMSKEHLLNGLKDTKVNQEKINQKYQELFGKVSTEIIDNKIANFYKDENPIEIMEEVPIEIIEEEYPSGTPIELIEAYERAEYDAVRMFLQKIAYGLVRQEDKDSFKKIMTYFANRDPLYKEIIIKLIPIIAKQEGILQSKIYPYLPQYDTETLRYVLYFAHELGDIKRVKKGRSYQLYTSTYSNIDFLENKNKV